MSYSDDFKEIKLESLIFKTKLNVIDINYFSSV